MAINANENTRMKNTRIESVRARRIYERRSSRLLVKFRIRRTLGRFSANIGRSGRVGEGEKTSWRMAVLSSVRHMARQAAKRSIRDRQGQSRAADDGKRTRDDFVDPLVSLRPPRGSFSGEMQTILNTQRANR